ncbi:hypothetical protein LPJ60_004045 [Coemansia sp. RSA 2675]|uniref:Uncharacterized protein n=1 Tax=Coemansia linderi TaxID=2663919 RepID=A0ACC1KK21_9FUNG|nr:hypothetical protein LPJ60_004045 [Coemansia sp. RSA 2675]KAJ2791244.1 hypothetical protein GGI18_001268 [Coemansia linderi]
MDDTSTPYSDATMPKSILKRPTDTPEKGAHLRWDEDNLRVTEAQKDAKMKVDEPRTPYIRYNPELDADLQEMEDLKLTSDLSSRSSSVASSPKRAHIVAPQDWISESEEEEGPSGADKAKHHEQFRKLRRDHYRSEGRYVHMDASDMVDSGGSVDEQGASSDEDVGKTAAAGRRTNGTAGGRRLKHAAGANFNVDEANAADMEI